MAELLRMPEVAAGMQSRRSCPRWLVAENTPFAAGDVIAVIETDKAVVDVEAESDGVIVRTLVADGTEVTRGRPHRPHRIHRRDPRRHRRHAQRPGCRHRQPAGAPGRADLLESISCGAWRRTRAWTIASQLTGTGPGGTHRRAATSKPWRASHPRQPTRERSAPARPLGARPPPHRIPGTDRRGRRSPTRRTPDCAARSPPRLTESKTTAPHFYLRGTAHVDRLLAMREELNNGEDARISVNDLVIKAVAKAHTLVPALNVTWAARRRPAATAASTSPSRSQPTRVS